MPGYTRRKQGRGFVYLDRNRRPIDGERREWIRALMIPPAWTDVWICSDERGHLQATGTDAAGRRQYLYHPEWRTQRDRGKFRRIERFAGALPELRATVTDDLRRSGYPRERILACGVRLLDRGLFRVGTEDYAADGAFGLATIRKDHVTVHQEHASFDFVGKAGKRQRVDVHDQELLPILKGLRRRRDASDDLLAWKDRAGWHDVRSADINAYLKEGIGEDDFSAKDFRTWHATVLAAVLLAERGPARSERAAERAIAEASRGVAAQLGNTPAVARRSYIDPRVIQRYQDAETIDVRRVRSLDDPGPEIEVAVLDLLRSHGESGHREAA
jgi:DNA topoisomerase-1